MSLRWRVISSAEELLSEHVSYKAAEREFARLEKRGARPLAIVSSDTEVVPRGFDSSPTIEEGTWLFT